MSTEPTEAEVDDHEPFDPTDPKLKPCPFCGSEGRLLTCDESDNPNFGGSFVECITCFACTEIRFSCGDDGRPLAVEAWNRRVT